MSKAAWIKWSLYAASGVCGILALLLPPASAPLALASTFLGGLATKTPGQGPTVPTVAAVLDGTANTAALTAAIAAVAASDTHVKPATSIVGAVPGG